MSDRLFTGRIKELRFFADMLDGKEPTRILAITGMGGIGKTELLKEFQAMADERHVPWAKIDGPAEDAPHILDEIYRQLAVMGVNLAPLGRSLREYARIKAKLPSPAKTAVTTAAQAIGGATQAIPGVPPELAAGAQAVSGELAGSIYDFLKPADVELYLDAPRRLTDKLVASLGKGKRRLVLFFDTYEKMLGLDPWLRELAARITRLGVWLVIAGQVKLDTRWGEVPGVSELPLASLTLRESRSFLRRRGVSEPSVVESIARFSCGVPLALHLAAELAIRYNIHDFGRAPEKQQIVDRLLQRLTAAAGTEETEMLLACAIPRSLTVPLIQKLLPHRDAVAVMEDLRTRPYVVYPPTGLALHDSIRESAYAKLEYENRPRFNELQQAAIAYYDEQLAALADVHRELSVDWHSQVHERLYHTLHLDQEQGFSYFVTTYWQVDSRFQFGECLNLVNVFLAFPPTLKHLVSTGLWFRGHALFDLNRWDEAKVVFLQVLNRETDAALRGFTLNELGKTCTFLQQWQEARQYLEIGIELKRQLGDQLGLAIAYLRLADVHSHLHTDQGRKQIELLTEALVIFERLGHKYRQADAHYHLSFSYRGLGRWEEAEEHAHAALALAEAAEQGEYRATYQRACILDVLAHLYRHRGSFSQAEPYAREALALFRRLDHQYRVADALQGLAQTVLQQGNWAEAEACLDEALDIAQCINDPFTAAIVNNIHGILYLFQGRLDEAQTAFECHLRTMQELHDPLREALGHHHLGELYLRRGDWAQAKSHLRVAIRFFYKQSRATFRAAYDLVFFAQVLLSEGYRPGGLRMLSFGLAQAEEYDLRHIQAWIHLLMARTLLDGPNPDREAIERHLDAAAKLAQEQEYRDIAEQVARLQDTLSTRTTRS